MKDVKFLWLYILDVDFLPAFLLYDQVIVLFFLYEPPVFSQTQEQIFLSFYWLKSVQYLNFSSEIKTKGHHFSSKIKPVAKNVPYF